MWFSHCKLSEPEALHLQVSGHIVKDFGFGSHFRFGASGLRVCRFWSLGSGVWGLVVLAGFKLWALAVKMETDKEASQSLQTPRSMALRTRAVIEVLLSR